MSSSPIWGFLLAFFFGDFFFFRTILNLLTSTLEVQSFSLQRRTLHVDEFDRRVRLPLTLVVEGRTK